MEKSCPSFPGYSVTDDGVVYSHRRRIGIGAPFSGTRVVVDPNHRFRLKQTMHRKYLCVSITRSINRGGPTPIHVLLADAFIGPIPAGHETRHLDGNPLNNSLANLAYGTHDENVDDRRRHGRDPVGILNPRAKLNEANIRAIRAAYTGRRGQLRRLGEQYGVTATMIRYIVRGTNWKHVRTKDGLFDA